jgi:hypothetical protein
VEVCPYIEIENTDIAGTMWDYVFQGYQQTTRLIVFGYGMLYNHSDIANVSYADSGREQLTFFATRPITAGNELTINYGQHWWASRNNRKSDNIQAGWQTSAGKAIYRAR